MSAGVRQGGILSPYLFSVFVDELLSKLSESGLGCFINCSCYNSFMYADDLILISISLMHMQALVDICKIEFDKIGMEINISKSGCMRICPRHNVPCDTINISNTPIKWQQDITYLGIHFTSAKQLTLNLQQTKQKFFRAVNGIFGKIGLKASPVVLCSLLSSFCTPILMYAAEALDFNKKSLRSLENAYSQAFFKIFATFDKNIIKQCQFYMGLLPIELLIDLRKLNFLNGIWMRILDVKDMSSLHHLAKWNELEFELLLAKFGLEPNSKRNSYKPIVYMYFQNSLDI